MTKRTPALLLALILLLALAGCSGGVQSWTPKPYLEINGTEAERPSVDKLREGIQSLTGDEDSYVYLELAQPLDGVWYLSAALPTTGYEDGLGYILEACVENGVDDYLYLQYRTQDREEVLDWFEDFYRGKSVPPTLDQWEDISDWYYYDDYDGDYYGDDYDYGYDYGYDDYDYEDDRVGQV